MELVFKIGGYTVAGLIGYSLILHLIGEKYELKKVLREIAVALAAIPLAVIPLEAEIFAKFVGVDIELFSFNSAIAKLEALREVCYNSLTTVNNIEWALAIPEAVVNALAVFIGGSEVLQFAQSFNFLANIPMGGLSAISGALSTAYVVLTTLITLAYFAKEAGPILIQISAPLTPIPRVRRVAVSLLILGIFLAYGVPFFVNWSVSAGDIDDFLIKAGNYTYISELHFGPALFAANSSNVEASYAIIVFDSKVNATLKSLFVNKTGCPRCLNLTAMRWINDTFAIQLNEYGRKLAIVPEGYYKPKYAIIYWLNVSAEGERVFVKRDYNTSINECNGTVGGDGRLCADKYALVRESIDWDLIPVDEGIGGLAKAYIKHHRGQRVDPKTHKGYLIYEKKISAKYIEYKEFTVYSASAKPKVSVDVSNRNVTYAVEIREINASGIGLRYADMNILHYWYNLSHNWWERQLILLSNITTLRNCSCPHGEELVNWSAWEELIEELKSQEPKMPEEFKPKCWEVRVKFKLVGNVADADYAWVRVKVPSGEKTWSFYGLHYNLLMPLLQDIAEEEDPVYLLNRDLANNFVELVLKLLWFHILVYAASAASVILGGVPIVSRFGMYFTNLFFRQLFTGASAVRSGLGKMGWRTLGFYRWRRSGSGQPGYIATKHLKPPSPLGLGFKELPLKTRLSYIKREIETELKLAKYSRIKNLELAARFAARVVLPYISRILWSYPAAALAEILKDVYEEYLKASRGLGATLESRTYRFLDLFSRYTRYPPRVLAFIGAREAMEKIRDYRETRRIGPVFDRSAITEALKAIEPRVAVVFERMDKFNIKDFRRELFGNFGELRGLPYLAYRYVETVYELSRARSLDEWSRLSAERELVLLLSKAAVAGRELMKLSSELKDRDVASALERYCRAISPEKLVKALDDRNYLKDLRVEYSEAKRDLLTALSKADAETLQRLGVKVPILETRYSVDEVRQVKELLEAAGFDVKGEDVDKAIERVFLETLEKDLSKLEFRVLREAMAKFEKARGEIAVPPWLFHEAFREIELPAIPWRLLEVRNAKALGVSVEVARVLLYRDYVEKFPDEVKEELNIFILASAFSHIAKNYPSITREMDLAAGYVITGRDYKELVEEAMGKVEDENIRKILEDLKYGFPERFWPSKAPHRSLDDKEVKFISELSGVDPRVLRGGEGGSKR